MKKPLVLFITLSILALPLLASGQTNIKILTVKEHLINPVTADYIERGLKKAETENSILILKIDTPGGLLKSTEKIVKLLLNSPVPVIAYIHPKGGRAASAGVFISYAAHIFAMSPSTHLGAAHPVIGGGSWGTLGQETKDKIINDTLAWAETIATQRNRPFSFIKEAIEESTSITEKEALKEGVCDFIAQDLNDLLKEIDGETVITAKGETKISIKSSSIEEIPLTKREQFLHMVIEPNIAYLLLTLGFLGLLFEITHPGFGVPGVIGLIFLILAFYAFSVLPINYAGVALIILGVLFLDIEAFTPTFGIFTLGAVISLFFGSVMLFNQPLLIKVSFKVFAPVIIFLAALTIFLLKKVISAQLVKSRVGKEGLLAEEGIAQTHIHKQGKVLIHGELWNAYSLEPIKKGEAIIVENIKGLKLLVKRKEEQ
ncbi:MAG: nodulation protein NfeD [Candidatus Omnitrophota bacterium]|nr:MAG: nodulation protein NfeD [Candidatus Omnitrophota bacterium]